MKKVLIATTNKDKFKIVSGMFKETIFKEDEYEIIQQDDSMKIREVSEKGTNKDRARAKALEAYNALEDYDYDYIVGLDDAIYANGKLDPDIKKIMCKILFQDYIKDGDEYGFNRAYCIIDKEGNVYEFNIDTPYIYHKLEGEFKVEKYTYPLSRVSYPMNCDKPICDLTDEESNEYYLSYAICTLEKIKFKNTK